MLPQPKVNLFWFFDRITQILCLNNQNDGTNIPKGGTLKLKIWGGWLNSLGSGILVGKTYFGVFQKN